MTEIVPSQTPLAHPIPSPSFSSSTIHRCGDPVDDYANKCLTCGCWGDMHPGAGAVGGGPNCVCDNLHYEGHQSQKEYAEERRKAKGHYVRKMDTSGHYCETPQTSYGWRGEIWQCDICHQKWKFKRGPLERISVVQGHWKKIR